MRNAAFAVLSITVALLVWAPVFTGCTGNQRQETIKTALVTVNTAQVAFLAWDKADQDEIVAHAANLDDGHAKLAAYRAKRDELRDDFITVYQLIGAASVANDNLSIESAKNAITALITTITDLEKSL
jgi:hypothetical protein